MSLHRHNSVVTPHRDDGERGSAIVEFFWLGILLLIPLVYLLLSGFAVQSAAYGVTQAAREAGRMYALEGDTGAATYAAHVALHDQGLDPGSVAVQIGCARSPCFAPGNEVTVRVSTTVRLPFLPAVFADMANAAIPVEGVHTVTVDRFREL